MLGFTVLVCGGDGDEEGHEVELEVEHVDGDVGGLGKDGDEELVLDVSVSESEVQLFDCWVDLGWVGVGCLGGLGRL